MRKKCTMENCTFSILQPLKEVTAHAPCSMNSAIFYFHRLTVHLPQLFSLYSQRNSSILSDLEELYIPLPQDMVAYGTTISVPLWKLQEIKKKAIQDFLFGLVNSLGVHAFFLLFLVQVEYTFLDFLTKNIFNFFKFYCDKNT